MTSTPVHTVAEYNGMETAFPRQPFEMPAGFDMGSNGLSKREFFAAIAMQGFIGSGEAGSAHLQTIAAFAVQCADALLTALAEEVK